jgi:hypothetical protein
MDGAKKVKCSEFADAIIAHMVLGSVAERIVRRSPVPVLSVRRTEKAPAGEVVPLGDLTASAV